MLSTLGNNFSRHFKIFFLLYPRHTKYAMGVYSFCLFCVSVCLSVCQSVNIYFVSKIFQELLYLETWNFVHMTSMTSCIVGKKIRAMGPGPLELFLFVVLAIKLCIFLNFVSKISQELLYLETWNFVHMTSMTSCIVGKKIRAMGPDPLELFPFVVLAIKFCVKDISGTTLPRNLKFCTHDKYD